MNTVIHLDHADMQKLLNGEEIEMPVEQTLRASENIILKPTPDALIELKGNLDILAFWQEVHTMLDNAMKKRDRSVSVYFNPETGISINTYPWPDGEDLWEMYKDGRITANDFRAKMGLPMVKNPEQFMMRGFLDQELQMPKKGENGNV